MAAVRRRGMIYGCVLGDAIGLTTEYKNEVPFIVFPYKDSIRKYPPNDWTGDSDHMLLVLRTMQQSYSVPEIALKLKDWSIEGFPELGDTVGLGMDATMSMVVKSPSFAANPIATALDVWEQSGKKFATNGCLVRTIALNMNELNLAQSCELCAITHADPRCILSCALLNSILDTIINNPDTPMDTLIVDSVKCARAHVEQYSADAAALLNESEVANWVKCGYLGKIGGINLNELGKLSHIFKTLAAAMYALQIIKYAQKNGKVPSFKKTIIKIACERGDASANCAVVGAIIGAYLGYDRLPADWIDGLHAKQWLDALMSSPEVDLP